ncbi:MAG: tetratricopeptide repeat protein [Proteobacteria bacterium]|nr:tetratricopeptide repeat protein [Pseudomonadota bacterium]MBU1387230.1 tetratricopeptide repeat protein [Pseudomonadota bacterium]MBU1543674.1 tetratricopeptide repeat protein [Pseudomonadota bacterium]MBU2429062.1 tetratricopeptide repeat protein [Pseudomonadota bacterium]MBU2480028.1 tetratricopeptide repeat protein [Pseudomonadota bacterium]
MDTLDKMIERIISQASGDDEVLRAFVQLLKDHVRLPADGFIIGEPVLVTAIEYNDNVRRGLTARIRREDGSDHVVGLGEVMFSETFTGGQAIAAFRKWLGLDPFCVEGQTASQPRQYHKATKDDIDLSKPVELVILSVKERTARCQLPDSDRIITLRAGTVYDEVPGHIVTVSPKKQWRYGGHPYLSGEIESSRLDVQALKLIPLGLADRGIWDPREHDWGEEDAPMGEWEKLIIARGPCPMFEMEQVMPGESGNDPFNDPISQAVDHRYAGKKAEARKILMDLCQADLRCLDAHSHLGHLVFDYYPQKAIEHYETGLRIGELSLGNDFAGVLAWGFMDNRPFLRCMQGYGLCLWRLGRFKEAEHIFNRMLWLNPTDNQGARFSLDEVKAGISWEDSENRG